MLSGIVCGSIGQDAEVKDVGEGTVTEFSVATTRKVRQEKVTTWVRCALWGKRGEALRPYLTKGTSVTCTGELSVREFESKGEKRFSVECKVDNVALQGGKKESAGSSYGTSGHGANAKHTAPADDDGIPF